MTARAQNMADRIKDRRATEGTLGKPDPWAAYHAARAATDAALARVEAAR